MKKVLDWLGSARLVTLVYAGLGWVVLGCATGSFGRRSTRPPRGPYPLEQARRWVEHTQQADRKNRRYAPARPKRR